MMRPPSRLALACLALCAVGVFASPATAIPTVFPVQGFVTDADGVPLDGDVGAQLTLYTDAGGNDALYSVGTTLVAEEGAFTYYLGSELELDAELIKSADALFLELSVNGETLEPRIEIGAVPYAAVAGECEVADRILINDTEVTGAGLQRRIAIPCGPNQAIRSVALDGIPVCIDIATDGDGNGDITAVNTDEGLNGGGVVGDLTLAVDFAAAQRRISNACPTNEYAVSVSEAGALLCEAPPGDIEGVTAGAGLSGGGETGVVLLSVDFAATQQRISNACPADQFAVSVAEDGTLSCLPAPPGDIESVIAGGGLTGGGAVGDVTLSLAEVACPGGQFQTGVDAAGAPTCAGETGVGTITEVVAGGGLAGGGTSGAVTVSLAEVACPAGQFQTGVDDTGAPTCEQEAGDGDITGVTAGEGLSGGGTEDTVALAIDDTVVQRRVQACVSGQLITAVAADGSVTCVDFPAAAQTKVQTKVLAADVVADGALASLSFSNLVVGRTYRIYGQLALTNTAGAGTETVALVANHNAAPIARFQQVIAFGDTSVRTGLASTFVATGTTVDIGVSGLSATMALSGDGSRSRTSMTIEEVGNGVATTDF